MKKLYLLAFSALFCAGLTVQANNNPYGVLYTILNTRCQNASCHSATSSGDNLKFDQDSASVYNQMFNIQSALWPASVTEHNYLINPEMPYQSFLLRKIAGAGFDTDLSIDSTGEGALMVDINGQQLANYEIEYFRQWIRYGALTSYNSSTQPAPDFATYYQYYNDPNYNDTVQPIPFLAKPVPPANCNCFVYRMGPMFLPTIDNYNLEVTEQQVVYFPYLPQITEIDGHMTNQSHHLLLFQYVDSNAARNPNCSTCGSNGSAADINDVGQVSPSLSATFVEPFSGNKNLTGAFQNTVNFIPMPANTALFWDQKTYLDFDYHCFNDNTSAVSTVIPCDFYLTIYYEPRNPNTIQMISELQNNDNLGEFVPGCYQLLPPNSLPDSVPFVGNYTDNNNGSSTAETRYFFMAAGHTHKYGTAFYLMRVDTNGNLADTVYNGTYDYANQEELGYWDWRHPPIEYWTSTDPNAPHEGLMPIVFGGPHSAGLVANTQWISQSSCVHFGFTTQDEMQLDYYMYTKQDPSVATAINTPTQPDIYFEVMPNPTNGTEGKLVYNLAQDSKVEASIVDITGKVIADLGQENEVTGLHTVALANGQRLASGIYFARLIINGNFYTKKFVVTE